MVDNSLCPCGQVETVDLFLIYCRRYQQIRINIFSNIPCPLTRNNLLFGNDRLTIDENKRIFAKSIVSS